jgi:hypothetical protein
MRNPETLPRVVRVISVNTSPGGQVTVTLQADSNGDENNYGFSLNYVTSVLSNPVVTIGSGATGGNVLANTATMPGKIGFSVDFGGGTMPTGSARQLVTVRFDVAANAPLGHTPLTFGDQPALRETSNTGAQALATNYEDGFVNILGPTASTASVGGRVTNDSGQAISGATVTLTDSHGVTQSAMTNGFGYYRFVGISTGETYMVTVSNKRYSFDPRPISVMGDMEEVNFLPNP